MKNIDSKMNIMSQLSGSLIGSNGFNSCKIAAVMSGFSTIVSPLLPDASKGYISHILKTWY